MYMSPRKGRANGFEKTRKAHQPQVSKNIRANKGAEEASDPDPRNSAVISPERPHRPWLVPGAGRL
jgi:hypothetical protein